MLPQHAAVELQGPRHCTHVSPHQRGLGRPSTLDPADPCWRWTAGVKLGVGVRSEALSAAKVAFLLIQSERCERFPRSSPTLNGRRQPRCGPVMPRAGGTEKGAEAGELVVSARCVADVASCACGGAAGECTGSQVPRGPAVASCAALVPQACLGDAASDDIALSADRIDPAGMTLVARCQSCQIWTHTCTATRLGVML